MKRWPIVKLASVTSKVGSGATPRGGESVYKQMGIPLIRSMNVHFDGFRRDGLVFIDSEEASKLDHVEVQGGDVLFNITGASIGRVTNAPAEMAGARVNQHVCILRPTTKLLPRFLCYYLRSPDQQALVGSNQVGGTRQAVTKGMLLDWKIALPPIAEQQEIVELLDEADELRKLRAKADDRIAEFIPAVFDEMFGDPDLNPKGWLQIKVGDAVNLINGRAFKPEDWSKDGVPIIRIQNLRNSGADFNFYRDEFEQKHEVKKGALLISWAGQLVSFGVHIWDGPDGVLNQHIFKAEPRLEFEITFLQHSLSHVVERAKSLFQGSDMKHLTRGTLDDAEIFSPPMSLQKEFSQHVAKIQEMAGQQSWSRRRMDDLFQSMLHQAFEGEL